MSGWIPIIFNIQTYLYKNNGTVEHCNVCLLFIIFPFKRSHNFNCNALIYNNFTKTLKYSAIYYISCHQDFVVFMFGVIKIFRLIFQSKSR